VAAALEGRMRVFEGQVQQLTQALQERQTHDE
jgi:hypothetical protein